MVIQTTSIEKVCLLGRNTLGKKNSGRKKINHSREPTLIYLITKGYISLSRGNSVTLRVCSGLSPRKEASALRWHSTVGGKGSGDAAEAQAGSEAPGPSALASGCAARPQLYLFTRLGVGCVYLTFLCLGPTVGGVGCW